MTDFGATLRNAREAKGLTADALAKATHMMTRQVEALENEDFSRFAAPIYGRGFVKLYCEAVGLDVKTMTDAFMELYHASPRPSSGYSASTAVSPSATVAPPVQSVQTEQSEQTEQDENDPSAFSLEAEPAPATTPSFEEPESIVSGFERQSPFGNTRPSRSAPRLALPSLHLPRIPRRVWRVVAVAACAIVLLYLLVAGLRALYNIAASPDDSTAQPVAVGQPSPAAAPATPAAPVRERRVETIPPLYIDK